MPYQGEICREGKMARAVELDLDFLVRVFSVLSFRRFLFGAEK